MRIRNKNNRDIFYKEKILRTKEARISKLEKIRKFYDLLSSIDDFK